MSTNLGGDTLDAVMRPAFRYRVFISYAHADHAIAVWLHKALEAYRVPKKLVGKRTEAGRIPARLGRCFRDEEELGAASELGPKITAALESSDVLVVICSQRAARSKWVNQEIAAFKQLGREARVFALVVDGQPHGPDGLDCFPPALKVTANGAAAEPLAVDLRKFGRGNAMTRIVSGILAVDYDDLHERERRQRQVQLFRVQALSAAAVLIVSAAGVAFWLAAQNNQRADVAASAATANALKETDARAETFASEARKMLAQKGPAEAMLMALYGDPAATSVPTAIKALRPDGLTAARLALVQVFAHSSQKELTMQLITSVGKSREDFAAAGEIFSAVLSLDESRVAAGSVDTTTRLWDVQTEALLGTFPRSPESYGIGSVRKVSFSPDGSTLVTVADGYVVKLWNVETGALLKALPHSRDDFVEDAAFSPDGLRIVSAGDKMAKIWDVRTGGLLATLGGGDSRVYAAAFSPDGSKVVGVLRTKAVIWDVETGKILLTLPAMSVEITTAVFTRDGLRIVVGYLDGTLSVIEAATGNKVLNLTGHTGIVRGLDVSPDGKRLVSASADKTAKLWDLATGENIAVFAGHSDQVNSARYSRAGTRILTASKDTSVRIWDANPDFHLQTAAEQVKRACAKLTAAHVYDFPLEEKVKHSILNGLVPPCGPPPPGTPVWPSQVE